MGELAAGIPSMKMAQSRLSGGGVWLLAQGWVNET